jgi:DNA-binding MarR family transcriptional regulator
MPLNIDAARDARAVRDDRTVREDAASGDTDTSGAAQRRLADELLDELTAIKARDRMRTFHAWHRDGISMVQLSAANLLQASGPMSMGHLAESMGISVASATGIVNRMEDRGLVERRHDATDRRVVMVHPAAGSAELFRTLEEQHRAQLSTLVGQLSADELAGFLTGLRALRAARERGCGSPS